jgi:hypothetical protein
MVLARWQRTIVDESGNVLAGATITVRRDVAGAPLAVLYSDRAGATPLGNPFSSDADGMAAFHAANGVYRIEATYGSSTQTWRYVGVSTASEADTFMTGVGYLYEAETADADPGAGYFRFNNSTPASASTVYISTSDSAAVDVTSWLDRIDDYGSAADRGTIVIRSSDGAVEFVGTVTGSVASASGYRKLSVTPTGATTAATFVAGTELGVAFIPRGADGADGDIAGPGATVSTGQLTQFSSGAGTSISGAVVAEGSPTDPLVAGTTAGVRAATPGHVIDAGHLRSAAVEVALSDGANVAMDWTSGVNFSLTMAGNRTLDLPSNGIPGTWRTVYVTSDGATVRTLAFAAAFAGVQASLTDITNTKTYLLTLYCRSQSQILVAATDCSP